MTRRERLEAKLVKRAEWADKANKRAEQRWEASRRAVEHIPLGQPILVGHHSEARHRRDLERSRNNAFKACEEHDLARHHAAKADGLERQLETCIFHDDDNAVSQLEQKLAGLQARRERLRELNKRIRAAVKAGMPDGWLSQLGATEDEIKEIQSNARCWGSPMWGSYKFSNLGGQIKQVQSRIEDVKRRAERTARAEAAGGVCIAETAEGWAQVTFAERPERSIIQALKEARFHFSGGSWFGYAANLPPDVRALALK